MRSTPALLARRLRTLLEPPPAQNPVPGWGHSLSSGAPGIALLHIERARAGIGDQVLAHQWAAAAARTPIAGKQDTGLFYGAAAVAFALHTADHPGYKNALHTLDDHITELARRRVQQAHARINDGALPSLAEYDLISGLTGIGRYLLHSDPDGPLLLEVLGYIVRLTHPLQIYGEWLPGWWTGHGPAGHPAEPQPGGHGNLGMAHGIAGPLALLSTAMLRGITVAGHTEAIGRICAWSDTWRHDDGTAAWWPQWVTRAELHSGQSAQAGPLRPSWCYGTPGQARAQQLAARALGDVDRQRIAERALLGCITDEQQLAHLADGSLCHGWAGLTYTIWYAIGDSLSSDLARHLPRLVDRLIAADQPTNNAGLLEGNAGTELTLHTIASGTPPISGWDSCLLITS